MRLCMRSVLEKHVLGEARRAAYKPFDLGPQIAVPLLALPGLAMADDVGPAIVRTVQDLENHDATRSRWGPRFQRHS
jgi:hypothetical protein